MSILLNLHRFSLILLGIIHGCSSSEPQDQDHDSKMIIAKKTDSEDQTRSLPQNHSIHDCDQNQVRAYHQFQNDLSAYITSFERYASELAKLDKSLSGKRHRAEIMIQFSQGLFKRYRLMEMSAQGCTALKKSLSTFQRNITERLDIFTPKRMITQSTLNH